MTPFIGQAGNILVPSELLNKVIFFLKKDSYIKVRCYDEKLK